MNIRYVSKDDLKAVAEVEAKCFPASEAASEKAFSDRLHYYSNHFLIAEEDGRVVGFVNGMVTDDMHLSDEMYVNAAMHNENGKWQMIFGVCTISGYRRRGYAAELLRKAITDAKEQGRLGLVLTCKEKLIHYYKKFGFVDEGISASGHGGAVWHEMRLTF